MERKSAGKLLVLLILSAVLAATFASMSVAATTRQLMASGLNAPENGIQTSNGRRFVSSNGAAYEMKYSGSAWSATPITAKYLDNSNPGCYFLGMTEMYGYVYVVGNENIADAGSTKHLFVINIKAATPVLTEIFRFNVVAMPNGMTSDGSGYLYLADNGPLFQSGFIYRLKVPGSAPTTVSEMKSIYSYTGLKPNGIKYKSGKLYISLDPGAYVGTSELQSFTVTGGGLTGKTVIYKTSNLIDDFIVVSDGFVIAEYLGSAIYHVNKTGAKLHSATFSMPTSITFLSGANVTCGDLMVTEASSAGNVYRLSNDWKLSQ